MSDYKEKAGLVAAETARTRLLETYRHRGLDADAVAGAIQDALSAKMKVQVFTPNGWQVSPGVEDHKVRLKAADMLADMLDLKTPIKVDLRAQGVITSASRELVEAILAEQGLLARDVTPLPAAPVTASLTPSSFSGEHGS